VTLALAQFYYGSGLIFLPEEINIPALIFDIFTFTILNPAVFLIPGIGLFLGLNGRRAEPKARSVGDLEKG
jgi:hypothetical protein